MRVLSTIEISQVSGGDFGDFWNGVTDFWNSCAEAVADYFRNLSPSQGCSWMPPGYSGTCSNLSCSLQWQLWDNANALAQIEGKNPPPPPTCGPRPGTINPRVVS